MKIHKVSNPIINKSNFGNSFKNNQDTINTALDELKKVKFDINDVAYIESLGAKLPFKSGEEAFQLIKDNNIKILYGKLEPDGTHACYSYDDNTIYINEDYKDLKGLSASLMIAEAIFHEAGHAKDKDKESSLQEEFDCLSLNVLAHIFYKKEYKGIFDNQTTPLYLDGVEVYKNLFFKFDKEKAELKNRMKDKYGFLPAESQNHPSSNFIRSISSTQDIKANQ